MQVIKGRKLTGGEATYEDWLALPENPRYELIEGELCMVAAPLPPHFWVVEFIYRFLVLIDPQEKLGLYGRDGVAVRLDETKNTYVPDLFFFDNANPVVVEEADIYGVPDFVVEVWNKNYKKRERTKKLEVYRRMGVKEIWEVFTEEKRVSVRRGLDYRPTDYLQGTGLKIESSQIEGLILDIDAMFEYVKRKMAKGQPQVK